MNAADFQELLMDTLDRADSGAVALSFLVAATEGYEPWAGWVATLDPTMLTVGCELMDTWAR